MKADDANRKHRDAESAHLLAEFRAIRAASHGSGSIRQLMDDGRKVPGENRTPPA